MVAPTPAMTDIITDIMVEVLRIFGIATKELRRGTTSEFWIDYLWAFTEAGVEKFLRKLAGMADLESALKKLDRLTQEEARMALAEVLRITHSVRDEVKEADGKLEGVRDTVEDVGERVADLGEELADLGDKMEHVGEKVEDLGDKVEDIGSGVEDIGEKLEDIGNQVEDIGGKVEDIGDKVEDISDKVQSVSENLQTVIDGARCVFTQSRIPANKYTFRHQGSESSSAGSQIGY